MGNSIKTLNQSGLSIVATVMVMMILALFAAAAVSLITTAAGTGIQEERGTQAFYIADGGMQYTLKKNTYPYYDTAASSIALGDISGSSFTVTVPRINSLLDVGTTDLSITVSSTEGFTLNPGDPTRYWTLLCSTASGTIRMTSDCEKMSFTSKDSTSFTGDVLATTRGRDSTVAATHPTSTVVMMYTWNTPSTTLARDFPKGAKCKNAPSRICLADTAGFATSGFIRINNATEDNIEDIFYYGKCDLGSCPGSDRTTVCGSTCTGTATTGCLGYDSSDLTASACTRSAYDGGGNGTVNHVSGIQIWQSEFSVLVKSTGEVPGAILLTNIKRVLQTNVLPLKDP